MVGTEILVALRGLQAKPHNESYEWCEHLKGCQYGLESVQADQNMAPCILLLKDSVDSGGFSSKHQESSCAAVHEAASTSRAILLGGFQY